MDSSASIDDPSIESEFVRTYKYIDLYLQQKTDLFLQHYVLEPFDFLFKRIMFLSVIVTLLVAGIVTIVLGVIFLISTVLPFWAALLITGVLISISGLIIAYRVLSNNIVLNTPTVEMIDPENP
ncbi:MAG: phage holin family protein [Methanoregula sp.]|nr:phage holin family protein [Methanoregula sp.]